jgi:hypothetical protein
MRKHILLSHGRRHILKPLIHHALNTHQSIHRGRGFAGVVKKDINSFKPPTSGIGMKKHHTKRIHPLKFKL